MKTRTLHYKTRKLKGGLKFFSDNWEQRLLPVIRLIEMYNLLNISDKVNYSNLIIYKKAIYIDFLNI